MLPPNTSTPFPAGRLKIDSAPSSATDANGRLPFANSVISITQPDDTLALEITFETGSVGPVNAVYYDAAGSQLSQFPLLTHAPTPSSAIYSLFTRGVRLITLTSGNGEGAILDIRELN
jgi:hypothetical protein